MAAEENGNPEGGAQDEAAMRQEKIQALAQAIDRHIYCLYALGKDFDTYFPGFATIAASPALQATDNQVAHAAAAIIGPDTIPAPYTGDSFRKNLTRLMDEYGVACIEDGEFFKRWNQKLGTIAAYSPLAAKAVFQGFIDYKAAEAGGSPPYVNTERIALKIGNNLNVLALEDDEMAALEAQFGFEEEQIEAEIINDLEQFAAQAAKFGFFEKKWHAVIDWVGSQNPELAGVAARRILSADSPGLPQNTGDQAAACNEAAGISSALAQKGLYYEAAEVADSILSFVRAANWGAGAEATAVRQALSVTDGWKQSIEAQPDGEYKETARAVFEEFLTSHSGQPGTTGAQPPSPPPPKFDGLA